MCDFPGAPTGRINKCPKKEKASPNGRELSFGDQVAGRRKEMQLYSAIHADGIGAKHFSPRKCASERVHAAGCKVHRNASISVRVSASCNTQKPPGNGRGAFLIMSFAYRQTSAATAAVITAATATVVATAAAIAAAAETITTAAEEDDDQNDDPQIKASDRGGLILRQLRESVGRLAGERVDYKTLPSAGI